jgi:hypothetical protein
MLTENKINDAGCHEDLATMLREFDQQFSLDVVRGDLASISLTLSSLLKQPECPQADRELHYSHILLLHHLQFLIEKVERRLQRE